MARHTDVVALQARPNVYGMIAKITAVPGKLEEFIEVLTKSTSSMPGGFSYVVAMDSADSSVIWVTEVWESVASHEASLSLPEVKSAISQARSLVAKFERIAITSPVGGVGIGSSSNR
jgi:quinol monooxygenase YgiN